MAFVVVFGAGGRLGQRASVEAADRGHHVIGVVHSGPSASPGEGVETVEGDVTDLATVRRLSQSADVLVVTVGGPDKSLYLDAAHTLVAAAQEISERPLRIIHSGGGGSLLAPNGTRFVGSHGFPEAVRPEALGQAAALDYYRTTSGVDWVYMSPPPGNFEPGDRTGHYRVGDDHPVVDAQGRFGISYEDYAVALVDEIDQPRHHREGQVSTRPSRRTGPRGMKESHSDGDREGASFNGTRDVTEAMVWWWTLQLPRSRRQAARAVRRRVRTRG